MAMFSQDATRITLVGSHLVARMPDDEGRMKDTELDLNDCIGNNNGAFRARLAPCFPPLFHPLYPISPGYDDGCVVAGANGPVQRGRHQEG